MVLYFLTGLVAVLLCWQVDAFCGSREFQSSLTRSAVRAGEWLRNQQDANGTYGEGHVSALVFHSLRLIGHYVAGGANHLNAEITHKGLDSIPGGRLSLYVLGALATCRDPEQFYNHNMIRALKRKLRKKPERGFSHPFRYALGVLAFCSNGKPIGKFSLKRYVKVINRRIQSDLPGEHWGIDTLAMEVMALSCIKRFNNRPRTRKILQNAQMAIDAAIQEILRHYQNDSTFHQNEVTSALAVQALVASGEGSWNCSATMAWLKSRQNPDGSFINLLATIYVLPSLIGALPYEVRDVTCYNDSTGENQMITVCVKLMFDANNHTVGKTPPSLACVTVQNGTNTHDILKLAAIQDACYNFTAVNSSFGHYITSICGIQQQPEEKFYWLIYIAPDQLAPVGIDDLRPQNGTTVFFKFEKLNWKK